MKENSGKRRKMKAPEIQLLQAYINIIQSYKGETREKKIKIKNDDREKKYTNESRKRIKQKKRENNFLND